MFLAGLRNSSNEFEREVHIDQEMGNSSKTDFPTFRWVVFCKVLGRPRLMTFCAFFKYANELNRNF